MPSRSLAPCFCGEFVISYKLQNKLAFLSNINVEFGAWLPNISDDQFTYAFLALALGVVLSAKNSTHSLHNFAPTKMKLLIATFAITFTALLFNTISEFLYFNF